LRFNPDEFSQEFMLNSLTAANGQIKNLWSTNYKHQYNINAALEGLQASPQVSAAVKKQLEGELKFLRAFCNFYLVNQWGDVPLVLSTNYMDNSVITRTASSLVYGKIIEDLLTAKNQLPAPTANIRNRPTKLAAAALLARVYLYREQWQLAEQYSDEVISSGQYTPLGLPANVFLANAKESIFQLSPTSGLLKETNALRPLGSAPQIYIPASLLSAFPNGDSRRSRWIDSFTYQSVKYYYPGKYKNTSTTPTEYYTLLRVAEQFLIRAEARLKQNKPDMAIADVNMIRVRAGIPLLSLTANATEIMEAIEKERRLELFAEWGHRWLDLKRWNRATAVLSPVKPGWSAEDELYPIPQDDLILNPFLTQNTGY
jgi:starch-binding outer membrane protein, SusD/RagB family